MSTYLLTAWVCLVIANVYLAHSANPVQRMAAAWIFIALAAVAFVSHFVAPMLT